jgi:hypothetical protein
LKDLPAPRGGSWAPKEPGNLTYASDLPSCQVIAKENGFGVIDPHGDLVEDVKGYLTLTLSREELEERVVLIDPTDEKYTVAFNPLGALLSSLRHSRRPGLMLGEQGLVALYLFVADHNN